MILENKQQFLKEYKDFITENPGLSLQKPQKWFDQVQTCHQGIRKFLNITKTKKIEIPNGSKGQLNPQSSIIENIGNLFPSYLTKYNLTKLDLTLPYLHKFKGMSTAKHLYNYLWHNHSGFLYIADNLSREFGRITLTSGKYKVQISTKAIDFAQLGHFGIDEGVCFANDRCNAPHKYYLGLKTNTFVVKIYNNQNQIIGRCWGKYFNKNKWFFSNFYYKHITRYTFIHLLQHLIDKNLKCYEDLMGYVIDMSERYAYQNEDEIILVKNKPRNEMLLELKDYKSHWRVDFDIEDNMSDEGYDIQY